MSLIHVLDWHEFNLKESVMYDEKPKEILDMKERISRTKIIHLVKVLWDHHGFEEGTWELELEMKEKYQENFTSLFLKF